MYAAEIKEERLSPLFDNFNQERLKVLNSLLEILFLDEFFEHFITKNAHLDSQDYFLKLKDLSIQNLLELI